MLNANRVRSWNQDSLQQGPAQDTDAPGPDLFGQMADRHTEALLSWAMARGRERADAWDLVQGAFEKALRTRPPVATHDDLRAWLLVVLRNLFLDECRAAEKRYRVDCDLEARAAPETCALAVWRQVDLDRVYDVLPRLSPAMREAFELHAAGLSIRRIAAQLRIPAGTVCTRLFRARRQLRSLLLADSAVT